MASFHRFYKRKLRTIAVPRQPRRNLIRDIHDPYLTRLFQKVWARTLATSDITALDQLLNRQHLGRVVTIQDAPPAIVIYLRGQAFLDKLYGPNQFDGQPVRGSLTVQPTSPAFDNPDHDLHQIAQIVSLASW